MSDWSWFDKIFIQIVRLSEVYRFPSALCTSKGMLCSDLLKIKIIRLMISFNQWQSSMRVLPYPHLYFQSQVRVAYESAVRVLTPPQRGWFAKFTGSEPYFLPGCVYRKRKWACVCVCARANACSSVDCQLLGLLSSGQISRLLVKIWFYLFLVFRKQARLIRYQQTETVIGEGFPCSF